MKKFEHILLASDIDGTIAWEHQFVNPRNIEKIQYFTENGGHFAFSSGRNHKDILRVAPGLETLPNMPCILCNGSYLYDIVSGEILNPQYLNTAKTIKLIHEIREHFPAVGFRATYPEGFLVCRDDATILHQIKDWGLGDLATICDLSEFEKHPLFKAVCVADLETLSSLTEYIRRHYNGIFTLTRSSAAMVELQPLGISKSYQFRYLKERYPGSTLWAIGDYDNDLDMLCHADVSACPANASDEVKAIPGIIHVCHCRDGALAELIDIIEKRTV